MPQTRDCNGDGSKYGMWSEHVRACAQHKVVREPPCLWCAKFTGLSCAASGWVDWQPHEHDCSYDRHSMSGWARQVCANWRISCSGTWIVVALGVSSADG